MKNTRGECNISISSAQEKPQCTPFAALYWEKCYSIASVKLNFNELENISLSIWNFDLMLNMSSYYVYGILKWNTLNRQSLRVEKSKV